MEMFVPNAYSKTIDGVRRTLGDEVLKVQLNTTGVVDHKFTLVNTIEFHGVQWVIYHVGEARNQRLASVLTTGTVLPYGGRQDTPLTPCFDF